LPLVLHRGIRRTLPSTRRTTLPRWVQENPEQVIILPRLVKELVAFTDEALLWAGYSGVVAISDASGRFQSIRRPYSPNEVPDDRITEVSHCVQKALFVGKWFAAAGSPSTIYGLLGIRP
jgi:hypothetical protein